MNQEEPVDTAAATSEPPVAAADPVPEKTLPWGEVVPAKVVEITDEHVVFDIGYPERAYVPKDEFNGALPAAGDAMDVFVDRVDRESGKAFASKTGADNLALWHRIESLNGAETTIEGEVIAAVKGGLSVDIGLRAFLPGSQAEMEPGQKSTDLIGQKLGFHIIKFNGRRGNIVLSRKAIVADERKAKREKLLNTLNVGEVITGTIKTFTQYGAFVDIGGVDGLMHNTDMSWARINHGSDIFNEGDEVKVKVIQFDKEKERISLSHKALIEDPWATIEKDFPLGSTVKGKVVSLRDYGAFVKLKDGIEGLVHVSELSWTKRINKPGDVLKRGQEIEAKVIDIDLAGRRLSLSVRALEENPWQTIGEKFPEGSTVKGPVRSVTEFGIFIKLEEGFDGLVHVSDMSWDRNVADPAEVYKKGQEIEAKVLRIDADAQRISLGIKQLTEDPWKVFVDKYKRGTKVKGTVTKIADFGAFVEIEPGFEGLCHISQLSEERVERVIDVCKPGAELEVVILDIDRKKKKISLSVKAKDVDTGNYKDYMADEPEGGFGNALSAALKKSLKN